MAIVKVYNRDGAEYGTLDTSQYVFNNNLIGFEPTKLDSSIYPYVKVNGVYYVNDGEEFSSKGRADNSAGLMNLTTAYLDKNSNPLSSSRIYINEYSYDVLNNYITQSSLQNAGESLASKIAIRDYQIQGSPISGLSFVKSMIKEGDMPYEHVDDSTYFSDGHYYWDTSLTNPNEFYLLTNFNDYIGTNNSYVLEVKSDGYLHITHNNVETAKIKKECIPYITLCSKWTESDGSSMKVYTPYISVPGEFNDAPSSLIFGAHAPGYHFNDVPTGTSIGIIGDGTYSTTEISLTNIELKLNTYLRAAKLQVCYGTKIEINPDYVIINGTYYDWMDSIFINDSNVCKNFKQVDYGKLIHEKSSNNKYFQLDKHQSIIKTTDYDTSRSRNRLYMTDGLGTANGSDENGLFSGYTITLSGKDYQINDDGFSPYIFGTSNRNYRYITWKKSDANKIFFNGKEATVDTSIQLFKWINTIQGKNGTLPKFIPLYNNQLASQDEHNSKFGNELNDAIIAGTFYPTLNLSFSGSVDSTKLNTWDDDYCALVCGQRQNNKDAYSMAGVKIGFEAKSENYGWTVLGMTENSELMENINDSRPTYTYVAAIPLPEDNSKHKIIYSINNKSSYKRKLYFKFDSEEFTINVPPLSTKYIACPVSTDYEKATGVTWVRYPDDSTWQEEKYEYKIDVSDEPTILVSTSGTGLRFDIENSFADKVEYCYHNANGNQGSQQISPLSPGSFYSNNWVWVNEELLKNSYISYNNPNTKKEVKILIGDITKKYQRPINFYVVHDVNMSYIVADNQTEQSTNSYLRYGSTKNDYNEMKPGINLLTIGGSSPENYYVYYYHPDNVEWQTKYYNSMPVGKLETKPYRTINKSQEHSITNIIPSGNDIRNYTFNTGVAVEAFDKTSATYEHTSGRRAEGTAFEIVDENGEYVVKSTISWYSGGGGNNSAFQINFTCDRYKVNINNSSSDDGGGNSNPGNSGSITPGSGIIGGNPNDPLTPSDKLDIEQIP